MRFVQVVLVILDENTPVEGVFSIHPGLSEVVFVEEERDPYDLIPPCRHESMAKYADEWL